MADLENISKHWDVVVIGAGPSGLAAANLLACAGIRTLLVEREHTTVTEPRAVSIDDESLRTMQAAGIVDEVIADVALDYGSNFVSGDFKLIYKVEPTSREYGYPKRSAVVQPLFEAAMLKGFKKHASAELLLGCTCEGLEENADGVTLSISSDQGTSAKIQGQFVIGADGASSRIRDAIGTRLEGSTYDQRWLIIDIEGTQDRYRQTWGISGPKRPAVNLPGPDGRRRFEFMLHPHETDEAVTEESYVRELISHYGPDRDALIVRRQVYHFHARVADRWQTDRVFLVGDAAHLTPPFAGQGMNSGVRDAHNIAWKLIAVLKEEMGNSLLKSYQTERKPHASALIGLAVRNGKLLIPRTALHAWLRRSSYRLAGLFPSFKNYYAQMKNKPKGHYVDGFVIPSEQGLSGRMAPQPILEKMDRTTVLMDEMIGNNFALLIIGRDSQAAAEKLSKIDWGLKHMVFLAITPRDYNLDRSVWTTHAGRDVNNLLANNDTKTNRLILLRPDRYVALDATLSDDGQSLAKSVNDLVSSFAKNERSIPM